MPIKHSPIAFLHRVVKEGPTVDTGIRMTHCVALKSPTYFAKRDIRDHHLILNSGLPTAKGDARDYFDRNKMWQQN